MRMMIVTITTCIIVHTIYIYVYIVWETDIPMTQSYYIIDKEVIHKMTKLIMETDGFKGPDKISIRILTNDDSFHAITHVALRFDDERTTPYSFVIQFHFSIYRVPL